MLLGLFHGCLQHDLSDREITLLDTDHATFMEQVLQRDRDSHPPPFKLSVVQGKRDTVANSSLSCFSDGFLTNVFLPRRTPKGFHSFWMPESEKYLSLFWQQRYSYLCKYISGTMIFWAQCQHSKYVTEFLGLQTSLLLASWNLAVCVCLWLCWSNLKRVPKPRAEARYYLQPDCVSNGSTCMRSGLARVHTHVQLNLHKLNWACVHWPAARTAQFPPPLLCLATKPQRLGR